MKDIIKMLKKSQLDFKEKLISPGNMLEINGIIMRKIDQIIIAILEPFIRWERPDDEVTKEYLDLITDVVEDLEKCSISRKREILEKTIEFFNRWRSNDEVIEKYLGLDLFREMVAITDAVENREKYSILLIRHNLKIVEISMKFFKSWGRPDDEVRKEYLDLVLEIVVAITDAVENLKKSSILRQSSEPSMIEVREETHTSTRAMEINLLDSSLQNLKSVIKTYNL